MVRVRKRHVWIAVAIVAVVLLAVALGVNASTPSRTTGTGAGGTQSPSAVASTTASPSPSAPSPTASPAASAPVTSAAPTTPSATPAPTSPAPSAAQKILDHMSMAQKVGQLLMVSAPATGADPDALNALDNLHVGNVFLRGRSYGGQSAVAAVVDGLKSQVSAAATDGVRQFVATDQEGGAVQVLNGPGFSVIPAALDQGSLTAATLAAEAHTWGSQLAAAGVNVNFAPVVDTVPSAAFAPSNAPIGAYGREFGFTPATVSTHGLAFAQGMLAAGVEPTAKHFPGLGRVTANTDTSSGVTDDTTVRNDAYIGPFRDAVNAGVPWMMVSNALYPKIDPNYIGPFSSTIITGMLRGDLGFKGIVVSDDLCDAVQVSPVALADRGVAFISAGGTMALCTDETKVATMYQGVLDQANSSPAFAKQVNAAALVVLNAKQAKGML